MRALLVALALCTAGCPAGLEEQQHLAKLRILGVRADPPELILEPDAGLPSTQLSAFGYAPGDAGVTVRLALCADLSGVPSPTLDCPGDAGIDLPASDDFHAKLDLSDPRILAFAAGLQVDAGAFDAGALQSLLDQGVPLLIGFRASTETESMSGFETITLRTAARGPVDQNPQLLDLAIGDGGTVSAGDTVRLQPDAAAKDLASERYLYSFFSTAGSVSSFHSTDTTSTGQAAPTWVDWTAPATGQPVRIIVVVRDGRGGIDWMERTVSVK
jgi:hypothetical protein